MLMSSWSEDEEEGKRKKASRLEELQLEFTDKNMDNDGFKVSEWPVIQADRHTAECNDIPVLRQAPKLPGLGSGGTSSNKRKAVEGEWMICHVGHLD